MPVAANAFNANRSKVSMNERTPLLVSSSPERREDDRAPHRSSTNSRASSIEEAADQTLSRSQTEEDEGSTSEELSYSSGEEEGGGITCRQYSILSVLMVATMTSSFAVCLFPPFFPKIAEEKGCSATVYGFIIGTNCLTSFIVTPFIGKNVSRGGTNEATEWEFE